MDTLKGKDLLVIGCGRMGGALIEGWRARGLDPARIAVEDPIASPRLADLAAAGGRVNGPRPHAPAAILLAVKPQLMGQVLPGLRGFGPEALVISIAAGLTLADYEAALGARPILRAMPNMPALVGWGMTALIGNAHVQPAHVALAQELFQTIGETAMLDREEEMDAVTAVSGSGPAYVFLLAEALEAAARGAGLSPPLARQLARVTVVGASRLMEEAGQDPAELRRQVTSPGGTTAAALAVLMEEEAGITALIDRAVDAARLRSDELAQGSNTSP